MGTPNSDEIGIFQIQTCDLAETKVKSWKPGVHPTVMENVYSAYIPEHYWQQIAEALGAELDLTQISRNQNNESKKSEGKKKIKGTR